MWERRRKRASERRKSTAGSACGDKEDGSAAGESRDGASSLFTIFFLCSRVNVDVDVDRTWHRICHEFATQSSPEKGGTHGKWATTSPRAQQGLAGSSRGWQGMGQDDVKAAGGSKPATKATATATTTLIFGRRHRHQRLGCRRLPLTSGVSVTSYGGRRILRQDNLESRRTRATGVLYCN